MNNKQRYVVNRSSERLGNRLDSGGDWLYLPQLAGQLSAAEKRLQYLSANVYLASSSCWQKTILLKCLK
ncbi:hypothetical protein [Candidatus Methylobacter favarea]|uniref:hypothetical protein n=1 Tax=Candidatus Methylobacter favarea TaxID=2707345 RepID=UPI00157BD0B5|nr:hypothetical protein [Candidatus Methylobacter favarea]